MPYKFNPLTNIGLDYYQSTAGMITGSGTTNYVSKFTSSSTIGDSLIYDNGTNVGIGTNTPNNTLQVEDLINFDNTQTSTLIGYKAGNSLVTGTQNIALGYEALYSSTNSAGSIAIGYQALYNELTGAYLNTAVGFEAMHDNTIGVRNTAIGANALEKNTEGNGNVAFGVSLGKNTTGNSNMGIGYGSLGNNTTTSGNVGVGAFTGTYTTGSVDSVWIGNEAGRLSPQKVDPTNSIAIGAYSYTTKDNQVVLGNSSITETILRANVGVGTTSPETLMHIVRDGSGQPGIFLDRYIDSATTSAGFLGRRARGSVASPTQTKTGDWIFTVSGRGYTDSSAFGITSTGLIGFKAAEDFTSTAQGMDFFIQTAAIGSRTLVDRMIVTSAGNVGIGDNTPGEKLVVSGTAHAKIQVVGNDSTEYGSVQVINSNADNIEFIQYGRTATSTYFGLDRAGAAILGGSPYTLFAIGTRTNTPLAFATNDSEKLRITASGNVGINTSTPSRKLDVIGDAQVYCASSANSALSVYGVSTTQYQPTLIVENAGTTVYDKNVASFYGHASDITDPSANVNVGLVQLKNTDNNYANFNFYNASRANSAFFGTKFLGHTVNSGSDFYINLKNDSTGVMENKVYVKGTGEVGIGTITPGRKLHLYNNGADVEVRVEGDGYNADFCPMAHGTTPRPGIYGVRSRGSAASPTAVQSDDILLFFGGRGYGATAYPTISNGAVLIKAEGTFTDSSYPAYLAFETTPASSTTRVERMRVTEAGKVGVNTTSPSETLTVNQLTYDSGIKITGAGGEYFSFNINTNGTSRINSTNQIWNMQDVGYDYGKKLNLGGHNEYQLWNVGTDHASSILSIGEYDYDTSTAKSLIYTVFGSSNLCLMKDGGYVGIGTANPANTFHVKGTGCYFQQSDESLDAGVVFFDTSLTEKGRIGLDNGVGGGDILSISSSNNTSAIAIDSSNRVGVRTITPLTSLNVVETSTSSPRGILSSQYSTGTDGARVGFAKARGTEASPTTVVNGDTLGRLMFRGYDGTNFLEMGSIEAIALGTIAATRVPTIMAFSTSTDAAPSVLTERMRITNEGKVGISTTTPSAYLSVYRTDGSTTASISSETLSDTLAPIIYFNKGRGTLGSPANIQSGDVTGELQFKGYYSSPVIAGKITVEIDNTPGSSDMPGRMLFYTTPDGSATPAERVRIDSSGKVGIGSTPSYKLDVYGDIRGKGHYENVTVQTSDYTLDTGTYKDDVVVMNSTSATNVTLIAATGSGRIVKIKNINTGLVTVDGASSDTIDGSLTQSLYMWDGIQIADYATNAWVVI